MPLTPLIHITATYSNAALVAILPYFSNFSKAVDLPIKTPITISQVAHFAPPIRTNYWTAAIWLTNRYWLAFHCGYVEGLRSPDDFFTQQDFEGVERLVGKDNMTTNEAIDLARNSFVKLGYKLTDFHMEGPPTRFKGPAESRVGHIPFCQAIWESPEGETNVDKSYSVEFHVDTHKKQIVGMFLSSRKFWRPEPKIDAAPEMEPVRHKQTSDSEESTVRLPTPH